MKALKYRIVPFGSNYIIEETNGIDPNASLVTNQDSWISTFCYNDLACTHEFATISDAVNALAKYLNVLDEIIGAPRPVERVADNAYVDIYVPKQPGLRTDKPAPRENKMGIANEDGWVAV